MIKSNQQNLCCNLWTCHNIDQLFIPRQLTHVFYFGNPIKFLWLACVELRWNILYSFAGSEESLAEIRLHALRLIQSLLYDSDNVELLSEANEVVSYKGKQ